jgi:hypothetical protein
MRTTRLVPLILALLPILLLTACSSSESEEVPIPTVSDSLNGINSYRSRIVLEWQSDEGLSGTTETQMEATREPRAQRIIMVDEEGASEWIRVGDTEWACTDEGCLPSLESMPGFGEEIILWSAQLAEAFEEMDYDYLGEETIGEVDTLHYAISSPPRGTFGPLREDATDVQAEIWVANEEALPTFVVRLVLSWELTAEGEEGEGEYTLDIYDVNRPLAIERPAGAPDAVPEDIPIYGSGAFGRGVQPLLGGGTSYSSQDSPATVAEFYRNELAALGWTLESEEVGESFLQLWSKGGWNLTVEVSPEESGCGIVIEMRPR